MSKMPTGVSLLSITGAFVAPERRISRKKGNMKSPEMLPPRKDPITNQDSSRIITQQDPIFRHFYQSGLLDIKHLLMMYIFQIK